MRDAGDGPGGAEPTVHAEPMGFETLAVHAGAEPDELTGAVSPPIYQTSTYAQDGVGRPRRGYEYSRSQNPTRERLERAVAALEGGKHGIAFASGSAATAAIAQLATAGDEIVVGDDVYGGTYRYFERVHRPSGVDARYFDLAAGPDVLWEALTDRTRLVWFETPTNPLLKLIDIAGASEVVRQRAEQSGVPRAFVVVDNTFASPAIQRPLSMGADIVFHSATKYLAGHSDTVSGVAVTNDDAIAQRLHFLQNAMGGVPGPLDCFLVLRGIRTLPLRMERHSANALAVAEFLAGREDVAWVSYPGLGGGTGAGADSEASAAAGGGAAGHVTAGTAAGGTAVGRTATSAAASGAARGTDLAARQMRMGGGMVSFIPKAGGPTGGPNGRTAQQRAVAICEATRLFTLAESLGGVESLIELPAAMTHLSVAGSPLEVDAALVRLSVGIETASDLVADLRRALDSA